MPRASSGFILCQLSTEGWYAVVALWMLHNIRPSGNYQRSVAHAQLKVWAFPFLAPTLINVILDSEIQE